MFQRSPLLRHSSLCFGQAARWHEVSQYLKNERKSDGSQPYKRIYKPCAAAAAARPCHGAHRCAPRAAVHLDQLWTHIYPPLMGDVAAALQGPADERAQVLPRRGAIPPPLDGHILVDRAVTRASLVNCGRRGPHVLVQHVEALHEARPVLDASLVVAEEQLMRDDPLR